MKHHLIEAFFFIILPLLFELGAVGLFLFGRAFWQPRYDADPRCSAVAHIQRAGADPASMELMMPFEITTFNCSRIRATAHGRLGFWSVDLEFTEVINRAAQRSVMIVHFIGDKAEDKANAYAKAMNAVDDQFHSIKTVLERSIARENDARTA